MAEKKRRKDHGRKEEEKKLKETKKEMNKMAENSGNCHPCRTNQQQNTKFFWKLHVAIHKDKEKNRDNQWSTGRARNKGTIRHQ